MNRLPAIHIKISKQILESSDLVCSKCGELFGRKKEYDYHMQSRHREKRHVCEICGCKALTDLVLQRHRATHASPTLPCNECGKMFHNSAYLDRHNRNLHTDNKDRPFQCTECGKGFSVKSTFEGHMNMHKGVNPYKCEFCKIRFQNGSNRFAHVKKIHPDIQKTKKTIKS